MKTNNLHWRERAGIYLHIPFCARKCIYCDFTSYAGCTEEQIREYFDALRNEGDWLASDYPADREWERQFRQEAAKVLPADSLFIGGGTPSIVDARYIAELMSLLPVTEDAERTIEANPGTLSREKLKIYRDCGLNRLSLGVQSFQDRELSFLGRIHSSADAVESFREARKAGFDNISLDLMFGFPGQTMDSWSRTLDAAVELEPDHISFYSLQIEEGTLLYRLFREDKVDQISDERNREMYHYAVRFLRENGYERYEISNAARPGRECRHNLKYWTMAPYFGLGIGAHSFIGGVRYAGPDTLKDYLHSDGILKQSGRYFNRRLRAATVNSVEDSMSDYLFTGLRLTRGIDLSEFEQMFAVPFRVRYGEVLDRHLQDGTMILENGGLRFTEKGIDVSNHILIDFI